MRGAVDRRAPARRPARGGQGRQLRGRGGEADLALAFHFHTRTPPRHWLHRAGHGSLTHLLDDPLRLLVPDTQPLASRSKVGMSELAGEHRIQGTFDTGGGTFDTGGVLDALGAAAGYRPQVVCRTSDYRFMTALVAAGVGVALLPRLALTGHPAAVDILLAGNPVRFVSARDLSFAPWTGRPAADAQRRPPCTCRPGAVAPKRRRRP